MRDSITPLRAALADRCRLEGELGAGGMAVVYRAHDLRHERPVALKVFHPHLGPLLGDRFLQEIRVAAKLSHPHILTVHDSGEAAGARAGGGRRESGLGFVDRGAAVINPDCWRDIR